MEIRHLQTFISIVELSGFAKAASTLGYAQSTITSHIQILENELEQPLFDRLGKRVVLTEVGNRLLPYAKEMISLYKEIKYIAHNSDKVIDELRIGSAESLSIYRLGKVLKEYRRKYPNVNIVLKSDTCS